MILKYLIYLSRFVKHFSGDCGMDWLFLRDNLFKRQSVNWVMLDCYLQL